jgi:hypothetical protein
LSIDGIYMHDAKNEFSREAARFSNIWLRNLSDNVLDYPTGYKPFAWWHKKDVMSGVYEAHWHIAHAGDNRGLLRDMLDSLRELIPDHPDVEALRVYFGCESLDGPRFHLPPMLLSSWNIIVKHSVTDYELVPENSYAARASEHLGRDGPWLSWIVPNLCEVIRPGEATRALPVLLKHRRKVAKLRACQALASTRGQKLLLTYLDRVMSSEREVRRSLVAIRSPRWIPARVVRWVADAAVWLPETWASDVASRDSDEKLSAESLTTALGMPLCVLERSARGLLEALQIPAKVGTP